MGKLVVIKIGQGSFELGFPVTLYISEEGYSSHISRSGELSPHLIDSFYEKWQSEYRTFVRGRLTAPPEQVTNVSDENLRDSSDRLKKELNDWLDSGTFRRITNAFQQNLNINETVRVIIQTEDTKLRRLPWCLWNLFDSYGNAEVALSLPEFGQIDYQVQPRAKVRILAILGDRSDPQTGIPIDIEADRQILEKLPDAETVFRVEPTPDEFIDQLRDNNGWDILFFAGHSSSQSDATTGEIHINPTERLLISRLRFALQKAIERGLQLAIFNSCDGLGLARYLAGLQIPQIIVMREPVPDLVAKTFLKSFLSSFSNGESLYLAFREARQMLHDRIENDFPCASWLPVIHQNPAIIPPTWENLRRIEAKIPGPPIAPGGDPPPIPEPEVPDPPPRQTLICERIKTLFRRINKFRRKIIKIPVILFLLILAVLGFAYWWWHMPPDTFQKVRNVPSATFYYAGSADWVRINYVVNTEIKKVWPQFGLLPFPSAKTPPPESTDGIQMLLDNKDLAFFQSSYPVDDDDKKPAEKKRLSLKEIPIAIEGIAFIVNPNLNITGLTLAQIKDIYTGKITNWKKLGGQDQKITAYSLPGPSSTKFLLSKINENTLGLQIKFVNSATEAVRKVAEDNGGIYYDSASEIVTQCRVKSLKVETVAPYKEPFIPPSECSEQHHNEINVTAFENGKYPLTRNLFVIVKQNGEVQQQAGEAYANLLLTAQGQKLIEKAGFVRIR